MEKLASLHVHELAKLKKARSLLGNFLKDVEPLEIKKSLTPETLRPVHLK